MSLAGVAEQDDIAHQHRETGYPEEGQLPVAPVRQHPDGQQRQYADLDIHPVGEQSERTQIKDVHPCPGARVFGQGADPLSVVIGQFRQRHADRRSQQERNADQHGITHVAPEMRIEQQHRQLEDAVYLGESRNHNQQHGPESLVALQQRVGEQEHITHRDVVLKRQLRAGQYQEGEKERFAFLLAGELSGQGEDRREPQREVEEVPRDRPQPRGQVSERREEDVEKRSVEEIVEADGKTRGRPVGAVGGYLLPEEFRRLGEDHEIAVLAARDFRERKRQHQQQSDDVEVAGVEEKRPDTPPDGPLGSRPCVQHSLLHRPLTCVCGFCGTGGPARRRRLRGRCRRSFSTFPRGARRR